jgi:hypothetical protein
MTEQEEAFDDWKSIVELHLELMVKKSLSELNIDHDLYNDFRNEMEPDQTAAYLITLAYQPIGK